mmetsp:Transcript_37989/g.63761  ORF Transcript_37989/g.63761 Transcript_37989/m.63761 type:complete len:1009 (+) Transcript_37989:159-3185(+)
MRRRRKREAPIFIHSQEELDQSLGQEYFLELRNLDRSATRELYLFRDTKKWDLAALVEDLSIERRRKKIMALLGHRRGDKEGQENRPPRLLQRNKPSKKRELAKIQEGSVVEVYWDGDDKWYPAIVEEMCIRDAKKAVKVRYKDGDKRNTWLYYKDLNPSKRRGKKSDNSQEEEALHWRLPSPRDAVRYKKDLAKFVKSVVEDAQKRKEAEQKRKLAERNRRLAQEKKRSYLRRIVEELRDLRKSRLTDGARCNLDKKYERQIQGQFEVKLLWNEEQRDIQLPAIVRSLTNAGGNVYTLNLSGQKNQRLGPDGAEILSKVFSTPDSLRNLQHLDLQSNMIEDEGLSHIANSLKSHPNLKSLSLGQNRLKDESGKFLADLILTCPNLKSIDLTWNFMSDEGASEIIKALETSSEHKMSTITFTDNHVKRSVLTLLQKHLKQKAEFSPDKKTRAHSLLRASSTKNAAARRGDDGLVLQKEVLATEFLPIVKKLRGLLSRWCANTMTLTERSDFAALWEPLFDRLETRAKNGMYATLVEAVEEARREMELVLVTEHDPLNKYDAQNFIKHFEVEVYRHQRKFRKWGVKVHDTPHLYQPDLPSLTFFHAKSYGQDPRPTTSSGKKSRAHRKWIPRPMLRCLCRNPCQPLLLRKAGFALLDRLERLEEARYLIASLSETFLTFGDYLDVTPLPLALSDIRRKLADEPNYYTDVDQITEHIRMVFENSATYYGGDRDSHGYRYGMKCLEVLEAALVYLPYPIRPRAHPTPLQIVACDFQFFRRRTEKRRPRKKRPMPEFNKLPLKDNKLGRKRRSLKATGGDVNNNHHHNSHHHHHRGGRKATPLTEWRCVARAPTSRVPDSKLPTYKSQHGYHFYLNNISAAGKLSVEQKDIISENPSTGWKCVVCDSRNRTGSSLCRFCWHRKKRNISSSSSSSLHLVSSPHDPSSSSSSSSSTAPTADRSNPSETTPSPGVFASGKRRKKRNQCPSLDPSLSKLNHNQTKLTTTAKRHKRR